MFSIVYNNNLTNLSANTDKFILKYYYFYMQVWATRHITNYLLEINFRKKKAIKEIHRKCIYKALSIMGKHIEMNSFRIYEQWNQLK